MLLNLRLSYSACLLSRCLPSRARWVFDDMCCGVEALLGDRLLLRCGEECGVELWGRCALGECLKIRFSFSSDGGLGLADMWFCDVFPICTCCGFWLDCCWPFVVVV